MSSGRSSPVVEEDHSFRYLVKTWIETLPDTHHEFKKEFPSVAAYNFGIVPVTLQEKFIKASFVEHYIGYQWCKTFSQYYPDMMYSNRNYIRMVLYACITVYESEGPFFERLLDVFGLVSASSLFFSLEEAAGYHVYAAPIMMVFFESFMMSEFYASGGWTGFEKHLQGLDYLHWYLLRDDVRYRNVSKPLAREIAWRWKGRSYHREVRFVSTSDAFPDKQCNDMADKVLAMDLSTIDRPDRLTAEAVVANANILKVWRTLKDEQEDIELTLEDREYREREVESEVAVKLARLQQQKTFESSMLKTAGGLFEAIKTQLKLAELVSETLKKMYDAAAAQS